MKVKGAPSKVEEVKQESRGLRGDLAAGLATPAPAFDDDGYSLLKFHGIYQGYDRDTATERKQQGLEKEHQFMVRVRIPGGRLTAAQYLALDDLADRYANGTLRITTRQSIQYHGVIKRDLKETIAGINQALLTTLAACGDVVRTVTTVAAPIRDAAHTRLEEDARRLSTHLLPQSSAYHEIWLDGEHVAGTDEESLYGSNPRTYPRLATPVAFVAPEDLAEAAAAVVKLHRDHGDRSDRRHARLKYLIAERGETWAKAQLELYLGKPLEAPRAMPPFRVKDHLGWHEQGDGRLYLGIPVASGRIVDVARGSRLRTALRRIMERVAPDPILTPQQDIILSDVAPADRPVVEAILDAHGVTRAESLTPVQRWALACPALPTCGLALTEAERVREPLLDGIAQELGRFGLEGERLSIRITGCPNGCARPYAGDIGIVGRMPGFYALYVGGDFEGTRLSFALVDRVPYAQVAERLGLLFALFAAERLVGEGFGDFCHRAGAERLKAALGAARLKEAS